MGGNSLAKIFEIDWSNIFQNTSVQSLFRKWILNFWSTFSSIKITITIRPNILKNYKAFDSGFQEFSTYLHPVPRTMLIYVF